MATTAPPVDARTAVDIAAQVRALLATYAPAWREQYTDPATCQIQTDYLGTALIEIFSRFAEIILQRLNQVPEKNFLAFLDLLGESRLPPQPAQVPLTFSLTPGSTVDAIVPAGTQVAAPPAEGEKEPVIFETASELVVTAVQLVSLFTREPEQDRYADHSALLISASPLQAPIFQGDQPIEHILYLGHETLFGYPQLQELRLGFNLANGFSNSDSNRLQWEIWDGAQGIPIKPTSDSTNGLTKTGDGEIVFNDLKQFPEQTVNALQSRWLRCRLLKPITSASDLPAINTLTVQLTRKDTDLTVETAFTNQLPVDLSKDFFPFGEKPRFGDTLYLANQEAFAEAGSTITLHITLTNGSDAKSPPILPTKASENLELTWEFWDGGAWTELSTLADLKDTTAQLTKSGTVNFKLPSQAAVTTVNGMEKYWIRVRISAGDYGKEARYEPIDPTKLELGYKFIPATFAPPSIRSLTIDYSWTKTALPQTVLGYNDFAYNPFTNTSFKPFKPPLDTRPTLYLGFTLPADRDAFPKQTLSLFSASVDVKYGEKPISSQPSDAVAQLQFIWQYWDGTRWTKLTVHDDSEKFTRAGLIEFLVPQDFASHSEFGLPPRYWLRVVWESGEYAWEPTLRLLLLNTTLATQTVTIGNEMLGSSDGSQSQTFYTTRTPVLPGQQLEVREPELPSAKERLIIAKEEGEDAIDTTPNSQEIWVRWHEVPDFYASGPRDRHYVLDHLSGEIRFGDGLNGLIPPIGSGNLRLASYQTGGGRTSNKPAGTVVQLKTTVPYVDKVINLEAATGGADAEALDALLERAPRILRHRGYAVTLEDYEDLALLASPEVIRAKCVPLRNLMTDPLDQKPFTPGEVSVIIVPRSDEAKPLPSVALINQVQDYLGLHSMPTAHLSVVGPLYVRVEVTAEIALVMLQGAATVDQVIHQQLVGFLHPLTGGLDGKGWAFGREPHKSDLYALLEAVPGVDHINTLSIEEKIDDGGDLASVKATGRFLVYSGTHKISLVFEAA